MRRDRGARRVRDQMATAGRTGAALFMMHSSFPTAASSWMMTPPPRDGQGDGRTPVYYSVTADSFRKPKQIPPESRGIAVERRYFRIHAETGKPVPLKTDETLKVGDVVEVELKITAAADYEYVAFEDPKPAGCEPVQVRSGSVWGDGFWGNVELRERKVVFFAAWLPKGMQTIRYRLRAETPGDFAVLPPTGFAMYAPDVRARGGEVRLRIVD